MRDLFSPFKLGRKKKSSTKVRSKVHMHLLEAFIWTTLKNSLKKVFNLCSPKKNKKYYFFRLNFLTDRVIRKLSKLALPLPQSPLPSSLPLVPPASTPSYPFIYLIVLRFSINIKKKKKILGHYRIVSSRE